MKAVDVFFRRDGVDDQIAVQVLWQGKLHEDAMHRRIGIELLDQRQQGRLVRIGGQLVLEGGHARLGGLLALVTHVDLTGRVLAYQHDREAGLQPVFLDHAGDMPRDLFPYARRESLAVDNMRAHGVLPLS
jgi:hypothetical protein